MPSVRLLQKDDYICIVLFMLRDMDSDYTFSYVVILVFCQSEQCNFHRITEFVLFFQRISRRIRKNR